MSAVRVDDEGLHLPGDFAGSGDVYFDDHHAWSFAVAPTDDGEELLVRWPVRMQRWLDGESAVRVSDGTSDLFAETVRFGSGTGRVRFVDKDGIPVMIDKWGLLQRPFSGRDRSVIDQMVELTEQILAVLRDDCGVEGWIAFGTLLGAAREGAVIGYDSDIDLAYLSKQPTPARMTGELFAIARALRAHGMTVLHKSGSFITVHFVAPDGGEASIDIYTCFYVGDYLHETATVRQVVPLAAIEPLGRIEFEGRMLPAPADPDTMLSVSYGPSWRIPDPSFKHEPGAEVTTRFDGWFGSLMRNRRDWERWINDRWEEGPPGPSDFARWTAVRLPRHARVIDAGSGAGGDALFFAGEGWDTLALDYARTSVRRQQRHARQGQLPATFKRCNFYDLRDSLTRAALTVRNPGSAVLYSRGLLESLAEDGRDNFWRLARISMRGGGQAYLEGRAGSAETLREWRSEHGGGTLYPLDPRVVEGEATRAGGQVVFRDGVREAGAAVRGGPPTRWRMIVQWSGAAAPG